MVLSFMLTGCVKNEFTIETELPADVNNTYKMLYYASDPVKGWIVESVLSVEQGKSTFLGMTRNPVIVYVFTGGTQPVTFFYAERGDKIKISGNSGDPLSWMISGNDINEELSAWRKENREILMTWRPGAGDGVAEVNAAVEKFVRSHPNNPVSTLLILEYYDRRNDESGFRKCWALLKGDAMEGKWQEIVSRNDMLSEVPSSSLPERIVLRSVKSATGYDTITFGKLPIMLYFSRSGVQNYRSQIRELKNIAEESDSSSRIIANILLEPDSILRWQNSRQDSLHTVIDGWIPLGISDARIRNLGIGRLPFVIVVDRKKKIVYRGDDLKQAEKEFKKLTNVN